MIDYSITSADAWWAFGQCILSFGFGFIIGTKLKLVRKIEEMV